MGGRLLNRRRKIFAGAYDERGHILFSGLPARFTGGSTHRAALMQDCAAVDIRCVQVREELRPVFSQITGLPYRERSLYGKGRLENREIRIADVTGLACDEAGYRKLSMALGEAARREGYLVVWDPSASCEESEWKR